MTEVDEEPESGTHRMVPVRDRLAQQILLVLRKRPSAGGDAEDRLADVAAAYDAADAVLELFDVGPAGELLLKPRLTSGAYEKRD